MVDISNIWYPTYNSEKNKKEQLAKWVKEYVNVLEAFTEKHPYECFLHHDVWSQKRGFK
jgi:predicted LPLAT superfamily acyltransferase